jgi:fucose permease
MQLFGTVIGAIALIVGLSLVWAFPTMLLWDWLMPELFGLKQVTLFQAWGLNVLCGVLFKSHTNTNSK